MSSGTCPSHPDGHHWTYSSVDPVHTARGHSTPARCQCGASETAWSLDRFCCRCPGIPFEDGKPVPKLHLEKTTLGRQHEPGLGHRQMTSCRNCGQLIRDQMVKADGCPRCHLPTSPEITCPPSDGSVLARGPFSASWSPVEGASHYSLELFDETTGAMAGGFPVEVPGTSFIIPGEALVPEHAFRLRAGASSDLDGPRWGSPRKVTVERGLAIDDATVQATPDPSGTITAQVTWSTCRMSSSWVAIPGEHHGTDLLTCWHDVRIPGLSPFQAYTATITSSTPSGEEATATVQIPIARAPRRDRPRPAQPFVASATISSSRPSATSRFSLAGPNENRT